MWWPSLKSCLVWGCWFKWNTCAYKACLVKKKKKKFHCCSNNSHLNWAICEWWTKFHEKLFIFGGSENLFFFMWVHTETQTVDTADRWKESKEDFADLQSYREQMRRTQLREGGRRWREERSKGSFEGWWGRGEVSDSEEHLQNNVHVSSSFCLKQGKSGFGEKVTARQHRRPGKKRYGKHSFQVISICVIAATLCSWMQNTITTLTL